MRALTVAVGAMGALIIGATIVLVVLVVQRAGGSGAVPVSAILDEPAGTRIAAATASSDWIMLHLQGGGSDRVVVMDPRSGRVLARVALAR